MSIFCELHKEKESRNNNNNNYSKNKSPVICARSEKTEKQLEILVNTDRIFSCDICLEFRIVKF